MITHLKISPNPSLKKRGTIENLKFLKLPPLKKEGWGDLKILN